MKETSGERQRRFCQVYLQTMDPERAAAEAGYKDGYGKLAAEPVQTRLEQMREAAVGQLRREDVLRRLAQLAFGRANAGVRLALLGREAGRDPMDLSAVSEIKVTDKGGVEIKFVDRVKALETLCGLLETGSGGQGAEELYRVLAAAAGDGEEGGWEHG